MPRSGGTFDQPAGLMDELRYVAQIVAAEERRQEDKTKPRGKSGRKRRRR